MANYALENLSNTDSLTALSSPLVVGSTIGNYIEISARATAGNSGGEFRLAGATSGYNDTFSLSASKFEVRGGGSWLSFTSGYTQPVVDTDFIARVEVVGSNQWEGFIDGVSVGVINVGVTVTLNQFFNMSSSAEAFHGRIYYIEACTDGTGTATNRWLNETGTGAIWIDNVSANNATQSGTWPADDSEWISYAGSGPTITPVDSTPADGSLQTLNCSGMTGPITAASIAGKDILASLSGTDPSVPITFTIDVSSTEATEGQPRIGETSTISLTTVTDGAVTTNITLQPKANWTTITLSGALDKSTDADGRDSFLKATDEKFSIVTAVSNIVYYSVARGEDITTSGAYDGGTTAPYQFTEFVIQQGGTATTTSTSNGGAFYPFGNGSVSVGGGNLTRALTRELTRGLVK